MLLERILVAPGLNSTDLLRTLARFGQDSFGLRVMSPAELAQTSLLRAGVPASERLLSIKAEPALYGALLNGIPYFHNASFEDAEQLSRTMRTLRMLIPEREEETLAELLPKGEFPEKNDALLRVYRAYMAELSRRGLTDTVSLLRRALREGTINGAGLLTLKDFPLSPLERALVDRLSGGQARELTQEALFGKQETGNYGYEQMTGAYGAANELEDVLARIYREALPLDDCLLAVTESSAAERVYARCSSLNIPVTFGTGLPIRLSKPAELLKKWSVWSGIGARGIDALNELLTCGAFQSAKRAELLDTQKPGEQNRIIRAAGNLRVGTDAEENRGKLERWEQSLKETEEKPMLVNGVKRLAAALERGCGSFVAEYSVIRDGGSDDLPARLDRAAAAQLRAILSDYSSFHSEAPSAEVLESILGRTVCAEVSREGCLFVTTVEAASSALRKNLFVTGLTASAFPGAPKENPLLLDSDCLLFALPGTAPTSVLRIERRKVALQRLLSLASACSCRVFLSYSYYRAAELKGENPSSVLYELYRQNGNGNASAESFRKSLPAVPFYSSNLSVSAALGRAYLRGEPLPPEVLTEETRTASEACPELYPTWVEEFMNCRRRFYLKHVLGCREDDPDDPFVLMDARMLGTFVHEAMEHMGNPKRPLEEILRETEEKFEDYLASRPPLLPEEEEEQREMLLRLVTNGYETDPGNELLLAEKKLSRLSPPGIRLSGYPDRIEQTPDGACIIADYKNKKNLDHKNNDFDTCIQALLYAYLAEENGYSVKGIEYRYLFQRRTIRCVYDAAVKERIDALLQDIRSAYRTGDFLPAADRKGENSPCRYCRVKKACGLADNDDEEV